MIDSFFNKHGFPCPYYILEGKVPKQVDSVVEWGLWYETHDMIVQQTKIGEVWVSTVFLGLASLMNPELPPLLFETMIFGGEHNSYIKRYATWEEAEKGHLEACELVVS